MTAFPVRVEWDDPSLGISQNWMATVDQFGRDSQKIVDRRVYAHHDDQFVYPLEDEAE